MSRRISLLGLVFIALFMAPGQSCVTVTNRPDDGSGGGGGGGGDAGAVTLRFVNGTTRAVDVQFYATGGVVSNTETDLFVPANQVTANIGFAGSGLLQPNTTDEVRVTCDNGRVIGTRGGRFLDPNSGDLIGSGRQLILFDGLQYSCGDAITFTYTESGGTFSTGLVVE